MIEVTVQGAANLAKALDAANAREKYALRVALRREGFRLKELLTREIRQGAPGGRAFAPLSVIRSRTKPDRYRVPLSRLASVARYAVNDARHFSDKFGVSSRPGATGTEVHVGFIDPLPFRGQSHTFSARKFNLSGSWLRLARIHQEGFWHEMSEGARQRILAMQAQAGSGLRKYFALRKTTTRFHTPARPIIDPFWAAHRFETLSNIRANYRRKIAGERI